MNHKYVWIVEHLDGYYYAFKTKKNALDLVKAMGFRKNSYELIKIRYYD